MIFATYGVFNKSLAVGRLLGSKFNKDLIKFINSGVYFLKEFVFS